MSLFHFRSLFLLAMTSLPISAMDWNNVDWNKFKQENLNLLLANAVATGEIGEVKAYVDKGADVCARSNENSSRPLLIASFEGHLDIVEYLVSQGAPVNDIDERTGTTAFHEACIRGYLPIVTFLAHHGANIHLTNKRGQSAATLAAMRDHNHIVRFLASFDEIQRQTHKSLIEKPKQ